MVLARIRTLERHRQDFCLFGGRHRAGRAAGPAAVLGSAMAGGAWHPKGAGGISVPEVLQPGGDDRGHCAALADSALLRVGGWRDLGLEPDAAGDGICWWASSLPRWAWGRWPSLIFNSACIAFDRMVPGGSCPLLALSAATVAVLEEALFRGGILGLVRRSLSPYAALFWVSTLFAIVHFLKPDESFDPEPITWLSGFVLIPHAFHQFAEPQTLLASFTHALCPRLAVRRCPLRTPLAVDEHRSACRGGLREDELRRAVQAAARRISPWIGRELQIGLVPVGILLLGWIVVVLYNRPERAQEDCEKSPRITRMTRMRPFFIRVIRVIRGPTFSSVNFFDRLPNILS